MSNGKKKIKKFVKGLFGKKVYNIHDTELGEGTEVTVSKKRTKFKGPEGKRIVTGEEKEGIDKMFKQSFGYKKGGMINRFKNGGIIQHD
jgi:isocitrate dehydrogenase